MKLIPKIISGHYPSLPENFSSELWGILNDIFSKDPQSRPTASELLERPIMIRCLSEKCKKTVEDLQTMVDKLRDVADSLERRHQGTTIGSLTGGVIGAMGGITSIVGLILAPFTLGVSLIVTGVGIGASAAGGVAAGASSITNIVNQSSNRKAVRSIIKKIQQKLNSVVCWHQEICYSLQRIRSRCDSAGITGDKESELSQDDPFKWGCIRAGKGLGGIAELVRLVQVMNMGKVAAQGARAVRVAEVATGVFSALFLAVDVFFIAMDAKEIHHIRQAKAASERQGTPSESVSETDTSNSVSTFDQAPLMRSSSTEVITNMAELESDRSEAQDQSPPIRSEIMRFVHSIRQAADDLQKVLDELKSINFQDMESM
ncbi:apolipoprotein L3-like [Epinephelus moara]|uniref:apolipoprotein L3-like n=1 Tax=Epinephelus moara TaxID=300413 RepID=UPI00214E8A61|nr:apolipoprotein L3-like [Epinephelus moara]